MKRSILFTIIMLLSLVAAMLGQSERFIAVLNLEQSTMSEGDAQILSDRLRYELFKTGQFTVLEREKMEAIMNEQSLQMSGCMSAECMVEFGKLLGVREIVGGSIGKFGNTYTVNVRLIDVETGAITSSAVFDLTGSKDDLLTRGMKKVAFELSGLKMKEELVASNIKKKTIKQMPVETEIPKEELNEKTNVRNKSGTENNGKGFKRWAFTPMFGRTTVTFKVNSTDGIVFPLINTEKKVNASSGGFGVSYYFTGKLSAWLSFYSGTGTFNDNVDMDFTNFGIGLDYRFWRIFSFGIGSSSTNIQLSNSDNLDLAKAKKTSTIFRTGLILPLKDWFSVNFFIDNSAGKDISHSAFLTSMSFYF